MFVNRLEVVELPYQLAIKNLDVLSSFEVDDKPLTRNQVLEKENRECLLVIRRAWEKSFDLSVIESSFLVAKKICENSQKAALSQDFVLKLSQIKHIQKSFQKYLQGLKNLEETYRKEAGISYFGREQKIHTAEKLAEIYERYQNTIELEKENQKPSHSKVFDFWKNLEKNSEKQKIASPKAKVTSTKRKKKKKLIFVEENKIVSPPLVKEEEVSEKRKKVTQILCKMAKETLTDIRKKKEKFDQPYQEQGKLREYIRNYKNSADSLKDEMSLVFSKQMPLIGDHFLNFEGNLKRKKEDPKSQQMFNLKMVKQIQKIKGEGKTSEIAESDSNWEVDEEEDLMNKRRVLVQEAVKKPFKRSISVYESLNRIKKTEKPFLEAPSYAIDDSFKEALSRRRGLMKGKKS